MKKLYLPSATAALFLIATLVACHGVGSGYNPAASPALTEGSSTAQEAGPLGLPACKAPKVGAGNWLIFFAAGDVKGTTFTAFTGKSAESGWFLENWKKVKPTPTPPPTPTPNPTPTPKKYEFYIYYGTYATKKKQVGCAILEATTKGEDFPFSNYNGFADGYPNVKPGHYKITLVSKGLVKGLIVSHLSASGGSGAVNLVTGKGKKYTTGKIKLVGRIVVKVPDEAKRLIQALLDQSS
ncbi:MAG: hypothetical protein JO078_05190 [Candidatus Eremiobacteraeota bacterium]|nr:hypothetical protein [Candidatus Eremiobacteraeota bacterium]MBV9056083.1 hypothetical protein [Candidatus Eremiobacteraeota bacterium]MBV9699503.1 hypothetical protein [Candidatus Eremiobacteraeota bacterium]